jgi:N-acetylmuramoyl-L-alanine amidase
MQNSSRNSAWLQFLGRHILILTFLVAATIGMFTVHWYFSPSVGEAQAVTQSSQGLSAPIFKEVPSRPVQQRLAQSPGPLRVGIIAGHTGFDSGAVCHDGLTEAEVNTTIAALVVENLRARGIPVDLLEEFDPRLTDYSATALVSIHADSCLYYNEFATGFKIAASSYTDSTALENCVEDVYKETTGLPYHANTITPHMTDYHAFRIIARGTPAIILEAGFMNLDRQILTVQADVPARGITNGILCYLEQVR